MEIITGIITNKSEVYSINIIKKYIIEENLNDISKTFHCYEDILPIYIKNSIKKIKTGTILKRLLGGFYSNNVDSIDEMNELYISCIGADGSDKVFETQHIDGPFVLLPFCKVFRTIVAIQGNSSIITEFPLKNTAYSILDYEFLAFDYNRDLHFIWKDSNISDEKSRIILKLHYIITPKFIHPKIVLFYKWLHVKYNSTMRTLFLNSQSNNRLSVIINNGTLCYAFLYQNMNYVNSVMILCIIYYFFVLL
jgi:hypothetical protein